MRRTTHARARRGPAGGMTLVELLVVVSIVVMLAAFALPAMRPALEGRRIRESARGLTLLLGSARSRAMVTGRPCGVVIYRQDGLPEAGVVIDQVEVPPPYAGDTIDACVVLQRDKQQPNLVKGTFVTAANPDPQTPTPIDAKLVSAGDLMQIDYQGSAWIIAQVAQDGTSVDLTPDRSLGRRVVLPNRPVPYRILRQPIKSSTAPTQIPSGAVIDLEFSGFEGPTAADQRIFSEAGSGTAPVTIMFSPSGSVDSVYFAGARQAVLEPIYLLVGKRERVPAGQAEDGMANWEDLENLWVAVNPQTGMIITADAVKYVDNNGDRPANLVESRDAARNAQAKGGR